MRRLLRGYRALPVFAELVAGGAVTFGLLGGVAGLIQGLRTYVPTAWAAVLEVGLPATVAGALAGAVAGSVVHIDRRVRQRRHAPR